MTQQSSDRPLVYIGTYTRGRSEGIYAYRMDPSSGALESVGEAAKTDNPSFLAIAPGRRHLYAVNELGRFAGKSSGAVSAFSIAPETGELTYLNQQPTHGPGPCHLTVDATGRFVLAANYSGGSLCVLPVQDDGRLGEATDFIQHEGSSVDPRRQKGPHAHSVTLDAANRYAFAADLGLDRVMVYRLDTAQGKLAPNDTPWAQVKPGAGPRHFDFHPNGRYAYLINELDSTLTAFEYNGEDGTLAEIQTVPTLPEGFTGTSHCADVHVSPSGEFVYGSNRGHDSIAIYKIDGATGRVTPIGHEPTQGEVPRGFGIDPTGTFLLAANQNTDTVVTFRLNPQTGAMEATGHVADVPMPVCVKIVHLT